MKILMTGATGWVGKNLGLELVKRGHYLICPVRDISKAKTECPFPAEWIAWPQASQNIELKSSESIEAAVNLAGEPVAATNWTEDIKNRIRNSRIDSTRAVVKTVKSHGIPVFISASATGFYGNRNDEVLTETSKPGDDFLSGICEQWEKEAFAVPGSTRTVALRIGIVLGKGGGALEKMVLPFRLGVGGPLAGGNQWMSWIHIDDLVALIIEAIENKNLSGIVNAVSPGAVRQKQFAKSLASVLGKPAVLPAPGFALKLALGEMAQIILASCLVQPVKATDVGFNFKFKNIQEALGQIYSAEKWGETEFIARQFIPKSQGEVFKFFSNENNLERITPAFLNFKVLGKSTPQIQSSTLIDYTLKIHGLPVKWKTEILNWNPPKTFIDQQLRGPYKKWHHTHSFENLAGGTLMTDRVIYKLPLGFIGQLVAGCFVDSDVKKIFNYRRKEIVKVFG